MPYFHRARCIGRNFDSAGMDIMFHGYVLAIIMCQNMLIGMECREICFTYLQ